LTSLTAFRRVLLLTACFLCTGHVDAHADFLVTPFIGSAFAGSTTLLDLDTGAASAKHWTFGGGAAWLSDQVLGVEAEFAMVPGFFENSSGTGLITGSRVTTLTGNVLAALPLSVSRESLRPYVTGGLGLIHATADDLIGLNESGDWLGLQVGAGAIGLISDRTGVRFDLRHTRALSRDTTLRGERASKLSFWRAAVGFTLRY
jgi:opacity protein-like surface antigen